MEKPPQIKRYENECICKRKKSYIYKEMLSPQDFKISFPVLPTRQIFRLDVSILNSCDFPHVPKHQNKTKRSFLIQHLPAGLLSIGLIVMYKFIICKMKNVNSTF